jgi:hypothetical protein
MEYSRVLCVWAVLSCPASGAASDFAASAAAASSAAHRYGEAIELRSRADVASSASLSAAQAQDLTWAGHHTEAVEVLQRAQAVSRRARGAAESSGPSEIEAVLARAEAMALVCLGPSAAVQALRVFNRARAAGPERPDDAWTALDLTKRVLALRTGGPPPAAADALRKSVAAITDSLLRSGSWSNPLQLPRHLHVGLAARPWHSVDPARPGSFPTLATWAAILARSTAALTTEFLVLHAGGLLEEERECIHAPEPLPTRPAWTAQLDAGGGVEARAGLLRPASWVAFVPQGPWQPFRDSAGCNSRDTPVACALASQMQSLLPSIKLHRLSYSALGPGAHLHPHWGQTNTQLKFHLGLIVPCAVKPEGGACRTPCARMRVGNETRAWREGGVLFFDDSFEHEVRNECDATRVVLQVVFDHPEYAPPAPDPAR